VVNVTVANVTFQAVPGRVNRIFLPFRFFTEEEATYRHRLFANQRIANCSSSSGNFDCTVAGVNEVIVERIYEDTNFFGQVQEDTFAIESITGEIVTVPYIVQTYNPAVRLIGIWWALIIGVALGIITYRRREQAKKLFRRVFFER